MHSLQTELVVVAAAVVVEVVVMVVERTRQRFYIRRVSRRHCALYKLTHLLSYLTDAFFPNQARSRLRWIRSRSCSQPS